MLIRKPSKSRTQRNIPPCSIIAMASALLLTPISQSVLADTAVSNQNAAVIGSEKVELPKIQLALLLDTSNSMDGLIDQTRNQLWQVVNEFSTAKLNGVTPILEIALFEYGNDSNSESAGFVRMLNTFTGELDEVSEGLFSLTTNGGNEYCGFAISSAINNLQWSHSDTDIKTIFIAGNEPFTQGPVDYRDAIKLASQHGISINTIHAGEHQVGIDSGWQSGAVLAGGDYMSIDANLQVVHIAAPQDEKIAELNAQLNQTYVPYGRNGEDKLLRQMEQDELSGNISAGLLSKRAKSKSSSFYSNAEWDLVDALNDGEVDEEALLKLEENSLPEPMKGMPSEERIDYVQEKAAERKAIKQEISELSQQRATYVAEIKREQLEASPSMSDALTDAVKKQAKEKNFRFEE